MAKNDLILLDGIIDDRVSQRLPSEKRDEAFEFFALEQLLKDYDLSQDELVVGHVDGSRDGGIDGAFIFVNGHLLDDPEMFLWPKSSSELAVSIITCKHRNTFKQATLDTLATSLSELLDFGAPNEQLKGKYSQAILNFRNNLIFAYRKLSPRLGSFTVRISYASRGSTTSLGEEVVARGDHLRSIVENSFSNCESQLDFVGSTELVELSRLVPSYSIALPFKEALSRGERYILLADLFSYYQFVTENGKLRRHLFDSNVRDFMGLNSVNDDIRLTLENLDSPDFWWLNNGITILATSASVVGKEIHIQDIQIVNGLQTTESIFRYFQEGGKDEDGRSVLIKVIVSQDDDIRDSIIRATNNQTAVERASLHATDKIQRDIEEILLRHGFYYERRKNFYTNLGHSQDEIIAPLYLAAGHLSLILKWPNRAAKLRSRFMRSPDAYQSIFSDKFPLEVWPKIAFVLKETDSALQSVRPEGRGHQFLKTWRHFVSFFAVSRLFGTFAFNAPNLARLNTDEFDRDFILGVWQELQEQTRSLGRLPLRARVFKSICASYAQNMGVAGLEVIGSLPFAEYTATEQVSEDLVAKIKGELPPQPWKPGIHKKVTSALGCTNSQYWTSPSIDDTSGL